MIYFVLCVLAFSSLLLLAVFYLSPLQVNSQYPIWSKLLKATNFLSSRPEFKFWSAHNSDLRALDSEAEHLLRCLEILLVKSETPLVNALHAILLDLPSSMFRSREQIEKIIFRSKQDGLRATLINWESPSNRFKSCISILLASLEGSSKASLRLSLDKLLKEAIQGRQEKLQSQAENLQLYLLAPALVMLLIISYPMMDAVSFLMSGLSLR